MFNIKTVNRKKVNESIQKFGCWEGYISPNRLLKRHIGQGPKLGDKVTIHKTLDSSNRETEHVYVVRDSYGKSIGWTNLNLDNFITSFISLNCDETLGTGIKFWEESN